MVHYNLGKTLADVENIAALPAEAAEAELMLRDDSQLIQARAPDQAPAHISSLLKHPGSASPIATAGAPHGILL